VKENDWLIDLADIQAAWRGELKFISKLVTKLYKPALNLSYQILLNKEDSEDCVQDSFYRLWKSKNQFQANSSLKTYFLKIVINVSYSIIEKRQNISLEDLDDVDFENGLATLYEPFDFEKKYVSDEIEKSLYFLTPRQRTSIFLWAYHDLTAVEIADVLGMNKNAVDQLLLRAKSKLKFKLKEFKK
jgi:RNA polymerase sigma-70 factor (ECF subfamily)